jgi:insulysin
MRFSSYFLSAALLPAIFSPLIAYEIIPDYSSVKILTPQLKDRKMLKVELKNGLKAVIISDPNINQSAFAISVNAGSWNDPESYPGTAHFCEHMLFMGTKKYPGEDEFFQYISDHGGSANAYTASDHTVYLFASSNDSFLESLDRISHFFIDPLFPVASVQRELKAVDQENDKNIQNDGWRQWMIVKETGNPLHPNRKFSTGNASTLGQIPIDVLRNWYNSHYSPDQMQAIIYTNLPLEEAAKAVDKDFSQIPKRGKIKAPVGELTSIEQQGHLIVIEPIKDLRVLNLTWEIKNLSPNDHSDQILADIIQSRHVGSLFDCLSKEELASSVSAGSNPVSVNNRFFEIEVNLTETGVKHFDQVIEKVFQYLQLINTSGIPAYFQKEVKTMDVLHYEYQTQVPAFQFVSSQIEAITRQPIQHYPDYSLCLENYNSEALKAVSKSLVPNRCIFFLIAKQELTDIPTDRTEKWLGGRYTIKSIPEKQLDSLQTIALSDDLKLPEVNPLIPQNLTLITSEKTKGLEQLIQEPIGKLYYEPDTIYQAPAADVKLTIRSGLSDLELSTFVFLDLLSLGFDQKEAAMLSQAEFAGLSSNLSRNGLGLDLEINGFSEKSKLFWHNLIVALKNFTLTEEEFVRFKTLLTIAYQNDIQSPPYLQTVQQIRNITRNDSPLSVDLEKALNQFTLKDFQNLKKAFFGQSYFEMFCYGNIDSQDSIDFFETVADVLESTPLVPGSVVRTKVLDLNHKGPYKIPLRTDLLGNSALLMIQNPNQGLQAKASFIVLNQALKTAFFDTLRTKQQTGYIALSRSADSQGFLQTYLIVQSTTHEPYELIARYELFLEDFLRNLTQDLPEERFNLLKSEVKNDLLKPEETMGGHVTQRFYEAFDAAGKFDENKQLAEELDNLTYAEFTKQTMTFLSRQNERRIALTLDGVVQENKSLRYISTSQESIKVDDSYVSLAQ